MDEDLKKYPRLEVVDGDRLSKYLTDGYRVIRILDRELLDYSPREEVGTKPQDPYGVVQKISLLTPITRRTQVFLVGKDEDTVVEEMYASWLQVSSDFDAYKKEHDHVIKHNEVISKKLASIQTEMAALSQQLADLRQDAENFSNEVALQKGLVKDKENELKEAEEEVAALKQIITELEKQLPNAAHRRNIDLG